MRILPFKALYPDKELIASPDSFFKYAKYEFSNYLNSGYFHKHPHECYYLYKIQTINGTYRGLVTCTHLDDFTEGVVIKHENTIAFKEQKMLDLFFQNKAMIKPILLSYNGITELDELFSKIGNNDKPLVDISFELTKERHTVWGIFDKELVEFITNSFEKNIKHSYIADGHHRSSSALQLYNTNHRVLDEEPNALLTIYIPFKELQIFDYNRVVETLREISPIELIVELSKYCKIEKLENGGKPEKKFEMTLYLQNSWYKLKWKKKTLKAYKDRTPLLDAELFDEIVLKSICNIQNVREDERLSYVDGVSGIDALVRKVEKKDFSFGVCLFPVRKDELITIANKGDTMPPKSTWFEPRIKNGMIVKHL